MRYWIGAIVTSTARLVILSALALAGGASATEPRPVNPLLASLGDAPFSFTFDGKPSAEWLAAARP